MDQDHGAAVQDFLLGAAAGNSDALIILAEASLIAVNTCDLPPREGYTAAEMFARLAAFAQGAGKAARQTLAAVLVFRADDIRPDDEARAEEFWSEAASMLFDLAKDGDEQAASLLMARLSERADAGDEDSAVILNDLVEVLAPATVAAARIISREAQQAVA